MIWQSKYIVAIIIGLQKKTDYSMQLVVVAAMFPSLSHFPTFFVNCVQKFSFNFTAAPGACFVLLLKYNLGTFYFP